MLKERIKASLFMTSGPVYRLDRKEGPVILDNRGWDHSHGRLRKSRAHPELFHDLAMR